MNSFQLYHDKTIKGLQIGCQLSVTITPKACSSIASNRLPSIYIICPVIPRLLSWTLVNFRDLPCLLSCSFHLILSYNHLIKANINLEVVKVLQKIEMPDLANELLSIFNYLKTWDFIITIATSNLFGLLRQTVSFFISCLSSTF